MHNFYLRSPARHIAKNKQKLSQFVSPDDKFLFNIENPFGLSSRRGLNKCSLFSVTFLV